MTTETLSTDGETTQVADTQQTSTLITDGLPADGDTGADGQTQQETNQADGNADSSGEANNEPEGAPEAYDFKAPEGKAFDTEIVDTFSNVAKELNLSQDKAQMFLDQMAPVVEQRIMAKVLETQAKWADETRSDKELGGDRLDENLAVAKTAIARFASPALVSMLGKFDPESNPKGTGLGNHPEIIRLFNRIGKLTSQDGIVTAGDGITASGENSRPAADVLYDKTSSSK